MVTDTNTLKVLAIGNSFSRDAMYFLYDIAKEGGEKLSNGRRGNGIAVCLNRKEE